MMTDSNLYNSIDSIDSSFFLYLTPEFKEDYGIYSVEKAYEFYQTFNLPFAENLPTVIDLIPERNIFLENFDYNIYYHFYNSNIVHDDYISDDVRDSISNDIERLSIIHYHRIGRGLFSFNKTSIDSNFNPYLYKVAHNITREMTHDETYYDYLKKIESPNNNIVIGSIHDLSYYINCNLTISVDNLIVDDTLIVKENIIIHKNAIINGNVVTDGQGMEINGGTIQIDNQYGNISKMFEEGRFSHDSMKFGDSEITFVKGDLETNTSNILYVSGANFHVNTNIILSSNLHVFGDTILNGLLNVEGDTELSGSLDIRSNLYVENLCKFDRSIIIGKNILLDTNYSLQTEKKIRVEGTDTLSDKRIKKNINCVNRIESLKKIMDVNLKEYNLINDKEKNKTVGVLAQEIKEVFPNIVTSTIGYIPHSKDLLAINNNSFEIQDEINLYKDDFLMIKDTVTDKIYNCQIIKINNDRIYIDEKTLLPHRLYNVFKKVDNLLSVDYTQLFTHLIGAVQQINIKLEEQFN